MKLVEVRCYPRNDLCDTLAPTTHLQAGNRDTSKPRRITGIIVFYGRIFSENIFQMQELYFYFVKLFQGNGDKNLIYLIENHYLIYPVKRILNGLQ